MLDQRPQPVFDLEMDALGRLDRYFNIHNYYKDNDT